ncbi:MAG: L,D-transpeptidase family protein [Eubacteriales bacterium]|nr:L,D-transpeptidase family protein [Eubacteriales bacterium]
MKNTGRKLCSIVLFLAFFAAGPFSCFAQSATGPGMLTAAVKTLSGIEIPGDAEVFLLVDSNHEETNTTGTLSAYVRTVTFDAAGAVPVSASAWTLAVAPAKAVMGRKGMGKGKEGDEKTPLGMFRMDTPFGICPAEEGFPGEYLQVGPQYYWSGDQTDRKVLSADGKTSSVENTYNHLVDINRVPGLDKARSEHLSDITAEYRYCLNIGYNPECVKGKGSALFLHCINYASGRGTGGCVAVDEQIMKQLLRLYKPGHTYILIR